MFNFVKMTFVWFPMDFICCSGRDLYLDLHKQNLNPRTPAVTVKATVDGTCTLCCANRTTRVH